MKRAGTRNMRFFFFLLGLIVMHLAIQALKMARHATETIVDLEHYNTENSQIGIERF